MKATEDKLSELHNAVAAVLTEKVLHEEEEITYDDDGEEVPTGKLIRTISPAMMSAAIKFLKDNSITADIEVDKTMGDLRNALSNKQKHSRLKDGKGAALKVVND